MFAAVCLLLLLLSMYVLHTQCYCSVLTALRPLVNTVVHYCDNVRKHTSYHRLPQWFVSTVVNCGNHYHESNYCIHRPHLDMWALTIITVFRVRRKA